jgi:hypothetical protein
LRLNQKLLFALTAYVVLGALAWTTLSNEPIHAGVFRVELRTLTVVVLGLFAFRTLMGFWRRKIDEERDKNL